MKIIFHEDFKRTDYAADGASVPGRMECIMEALVEEGGYGVVSPEQASSGDLSLAHSKTHIAGIAKDAKLFEMASLSAGGAILASEIAFRREPAFACIRPPGHHASNNSSWGYCAFCNMGIALLKLREKGLIKSAFVLDFDAHTGDGTIDVLSEWKDVRILNPMAGNNKDYLGEIENCIHDIGYVDIVGVSAGFDSY
jgi:acetoin utilization deacetylase AcuC-like enzyme